MGRNDDGSGMEGNGWGFGFWKINLGHVMVILVWLVTVVSAWASLGKDVEENRRRLDAVERKVDDVSVIRNDVAWIKDAVRDLKEK